MYDVCMLLMGDVTYDSRVLREAEALADAGYSVMLLALHDREAGPAIEHRDGFTIRRITVQRSILTAIYHRALLYPLNRLAAWLYQRHPAVIWHDLFLNAWRLWTMRYRTAVKAVLSTPARVYHAHDYTALLVLHAAGLRPLIYDSHELFFDRPMPDVFQGRETFYQTVTQIERQQERQMIEQVDRVITVGDLIADHMADQWDITRPVVVRNAVVLEPDQPPAVSFEQAGRRLLVHSGLLTVGRHLPQMIDMLAHLPDDAALVLLGDGPLREPLQRRAVAAGVQDRLLIMPPVGWRSVAATLAQADLALVLVESEDRSYRFSLPNKFFEAVGAGLPLVVSPIPEVAHLTRHYDMGLVCPDPHDPQAVAQVVMQALQPEENQRLRANALAARQVLNWGQESQRLVGLYADMLV